MKYSKLTLLVILIVLKIDIAAKNNVQLYLGTYYNKLQASSDNFNITHKANSIGTLSPVLGVNLKAKKFSYGAELKFFKVNYSNEFKYKDLGKTNAVISTWSSRLPEMSLFFKHQIVYFKKSYLNFNTMLNIANNSTPFDETTLIFAPNSNVLYSNNRPNIGYFYSMSIGLEYVHKINSRYNIFVSSQVNSNFNRTLVEENNTIVYPDQTLAYQFLKINGKSFGGSIGIMYNLKRIQ